MVPKSVSNGRPPAKRSPCSVVWHASQSAASDEIAAARERIGLGEVGGHARRLAGGVRGELYALAIGKRHRTGAKHEPGGNREPDQDHDADNLANAFLSHADFPCKIYIFRAVTAGALFNVNGARHAS